MTHDEKIYAIATGIEEASRMFGVDCSGWFSSIVEKIPENSSNNDKSTVYPLTEQVKIGA